MFDDLSQVKRRYEELAYRMTTPEAMNDPAAYAAMMRYPPKHFLTYILKASILCACYYKIR